MEYLKPKLTLWVGNDRIIPNKGRYFLCSATLFPTNTIAWDGYNFQVTKKQGEPDQVEVQLYIKDFDPEEPQEGDTLVEHFVDLGKLKHKADNPQEISMITATVMYRDGRIPQLPAEQLASRSLAGLTNADAVTIYDDIVGDDISFTARNTTTSSTTTTSTTNGKVDTP